jgi:hypothetical protein
MDCAPWSVVAYRIAAASGNNCCSRDAVVEAVRDTPVTDPHQDVQLTNRRDSKISSGSTLAQLISNQAP